MIRTVKRPNSLPTSRLQTKISAFGHWYLKIILLMAENFAFRHKKTPFNAFIAILEPLGLIAIMSLLVAAFERQPRYGESAILFFASGIIPYSVFMNVSLRVKQSDGTRRLPRVTTFDMLLANILDELLLKFIVFALICAALYFFQDISQAVPVDPAVCIAALVVLAAFGLAAGMTNVGIYAVFPMWQFIYPYAVRFLLLFSGAGWVMDLVPSRIQAYMVLDPIAHAIVWFRTGLYPNYPARLLDLEYMFVFLACFLVIGVIAEALTKEWRHR